MNFKFLPLAALLFGAASPLPSVAAQPSSDPRRATAAEASGLFNAGERVAARLLREGKIDRTYRIDLALETLLDFSAATGRDKWRDYVFSVMRQRGMKPDAAVPYRSQPFSCLTLAIFHETGDRAWLPVFLQETALSLQEHARSPEGGIMHPKGAQRGGGNALLIDAMAAYAARMAAAGAISGQAGYFRECAAQYRIYRALLRDPQTGLWSQGRGWLAADPMALSPGAWSRGHGWLLRGLISVLHDLPKGSAEFEELHGYLTEFAEALLPLQSPTGLWPTLLHRPASDSPLDESGTAMIATALSHAWRAEWLRDPRVHDSAKRAFAALPSYVDADGVVLGVSPGPGPLESEADYLQKEFPPGNDHGPFSLLLAAAEASRLASADQKSM